MSTITTILQASSISLSLLAAGGIATLSLFDVPILQSQPASRSLPSIRWLFSRGSHIFPTVALLTAGGFGTLAMRALPPSLSLSLSSSATAVATATLPRVLLQVLSGRGGARTNGYLAAGALCLSIGPFTSYMLPNNLAFTQMNADKGGARSAQVAAEGVARPGRSAAQSVRGEGEGNEFADWSGPQGKTRDDSTAQEDDEVRERLATFWRQNMVRAVLMGTGGILGLVTALA